jgi:hypothetical protein
MAKGSGRHVKSPVRRTVERTEHFEGWEQTLHAEQRAKVAAAIARVVAGGPLMGRPHVDTLHGTSLAKLKEARVDHGTRLMFAFDSNQNVVMLLGGDKTGKWKHWYPHQIDHAKQLYADHERKNGKGVPLSEPGSNAKDTAGGGSVSAMRTEIYRRLMEAQETVAHALYRRGVSHADVLAALDAVDERISDDERREDLYLSALDHYVAALGGRIEVRAVFGDDQVVVRRSPEELS